MQKYLMAVFYILYKYITHSLNINDQVILNKSTGKTFVNLNICGLIPDLCCSKSLNKLNITKECRKLIVCACEWAKTFY